MHNEQKTFEKRVVNTLDIKEEINCLCVLSENRVALALNSGFIQIHDLLTKEVSIIDGSVNPVHAYVYKMVEVKAPINYLVCLTDRIDDVGM